MGAAAQGGAEGTHIGLIRSDSADCAPMFWLCSLPLLDGADQTWNTLQQLTTHQNDYSRNFKFQVPELRVGTLDSLMVLSDDLVKVNALVEAVVNKVRRQLFELSSTTGDEMGEVLVEGSTPEAYLERFAWDEAKYPPRRPLKETVEAITETIQQLEDNLKVRVCCCAACFSTLVPSVCVQAALWVGGRHLHRRDRCMRRCPKRKLFAAAHRSE